MSPLAHKSRNSTEGVLLLPRTDLLTECTEGHEAMDRQHVGTPSFVRIIPNLGGNNTDIPSRHSRGSHFVILGIPITSCPVERLFSVVADSSDKWTILIVRRVFWSPDTMTFLSLNTINDVIVFGSKD